VQNKSSSIFSSVGTPTRQQVSCKQSRKEKKDQIKQDRDHIHTRCQEHAIQNYCNAGGPISPAGFWVL